MISDNEIKLLQEINNLFNKSLMGKLPEKIDVNSQCDENFAVLINSINNFFDNYIETCEYLKNIIEGKLDFVASKGGLLSKNYIKTLQMTLNHLTYKTKMIANGDFTQRINFLGEFSIAYNYMVEMLDENIKKVNEQANQLKEYQEQKINIALEKERLLRKITEKIIHSVDIEETKKYLIKAVGEYFDVDRCIFTDYNKTTNKFVPFIYESLKADKIQSLLGVELEQEFPEFCTKLKKGRDIIIHDLDKTLSRKNILKYKSIKTLKEFGVKSDYGLIIKHKDQILGLLVLHFIEERRILSSDELNFLKTLRDQIGIALYQANLFQEKQQIAENEKTLRQMMAGSAKTLDFEKTINSIVNEAGRFFKADRCFFIEYDYSTDTNLPINGYAQYLSSKNIISHLTIQPDKNNTAAFVKLSKEKNIIIADNIFEVDLHESTREMLIDVLSVKSYLISPVYYDDVIYGSIVLHYVDSFKKFTTDDLNMAKAIAHHAAIIIHKSKLYEAMQKNLKREKTVLDNISDAIITMNNNFMIETCNPSVEKIWGYKSSEVIGQNLEILLNFRCELNEGKICLIKKDSYGIRKNGEIFPIEIEIKDIEVDDKKLTLLVIRDITEREKVDKMKREFISTVSHELRTPLTSIMGSLGLIASGKIQEISKKTKDLLEIANGNCLRLITLINDILDIEKIEAGKMEFKLNIVDIIPLIHKAIQLNTQYAQKFNVSMKFEDNIGQAFVNIDNDRLMQVVTNLLSNAVKFSLPKSTVNIAAKKNNDNIVISITNYGIEIPEEFKKRIFQKFAQADSSDSRQKGGTGLGLSISKAIIEKLNGRIGFVSENNQTTFCFELPLSIALKA